MGQCTYRTYCLSERANSSSNSRSSSVPFCHLLKLILTVNQGKVPLTMFLSRRDEYVHSLFLFLFALPARGTIATTSSIAITTATAHLQYLFTAELAS